MQKRIRRCTGSVAIHVRWSFSFVALLRLRMSRTISQRASAAGVTIAVSLERAARENIRAARSALALVNSNSKPGVSRAGTNRSCRPQNHTFLSPTPRIPSACIASRARSGANLDGGYFEEFGWEPLPSVTMTTLMWTPRLARTAIKPPHPMLSSSGCGTTIRTRNPSWAGSRPVTRDSATTPGILPLMPARPPKLKRHPVPVAEDRLSGLG